MDADMVQKIKQRIDSNPQLGWKVDYGRRWPNTHIWSLRIVRIDGHPDHTYRWINTPEEWTKIANEAVL